MSSLSSYLQDHYTGLANRKEAAVLGLRKIFLHLKTACPQLQRIEIEYEGSGDSGQVDSITYGDGTNYFDLPDSLARQPLPTSVVELTLPWKPDANVSADHALAEYGWDVAYGQNPGFEINEGGSGVVTVDIEPDAELSMDNIKVYLEHRERVEHVNEYSYDF